MTRSATNIHIFATCVESRVAGLFIDHPQTLHKYRVIACTLLTGFKLCDMLMVMYGTHILHNLKDKISCSLRE